jgi:spermidine/putrescine transport system substrate-binding protein
MKLSRFVLIGAVIAIVIGGVFFMKSRVTSPGALQLYTWSSYFPEEMIEEFTKTTGIPVEVSYFSSNEELFAKMVAGAGGYDVIIPSDYMIARMINRQMLLPLDPQQLPNLAGIDPYYRELPYDKGLKYSVPFGLGYTGLVINTKFVKVENEVSWDILFHSPDPKHTSYLDDMREVFAMGLMHAGLPATSQDPQQLKKVAADLQKAKNQMAMFSSEPVALLLKGELHIAHAFSAHAMQVVRESKDFQFFFPKEGATSWTDNYAIPKGARRPAEAHKFINFFLEPARMAKTSEAAGLGAAAKAARDLLGAEIKANPFLYPTAQVTKRLHFLDDLTGESLTTMNRLWTEMKTHD